MILMHTLFKPEVRRLISPALLGLPLVTLLLLAGGCDRSNKTTEKIKQDTQELENFDPNLTFNAVTLEEFDKQGRLLWKVKAKQASYSKDKKIARVSEPAGGLFQDGKLIIQVSAQSGEVVQDGEKIVLRGNIQALDTRTGMELQGNEMEWFPQKELILVRNNVTGTHKKVKVTAKEGRFLSRKKQAELTGQVYAESQDPNVRFQSERLVWEIEKRMLSSDRPLQMERYQGTTVSDRATAGAGTVNLKQKTAALKQNAVLTLSDPPVQANSNDLLWNLDARTVIAQQPVTIVNQKQGVTLVGNQGQMDLNTKIFYLTGGVSGVGTQNQSQVNADRLTWNMNTEQFEADGNVTYRQANPPFNLTGPKASGRIKDQIVVVSGGRVMTEFIPGTTLVR
jgi:LPS export ABC transporter protein LptC